MFCPKCGSQNGAVTKFCRVCGADLRSAVVLGPSPEMLALAEKQIDLHGSGLRGVIIGTGFLIVAATAFEISVNLAVMGLFALAFGFFFLGTGISRLIQSKGIKALMTPDSASPALRTPESEYARLSQGAFDTDDLAVPPASVTDRTTRHLQK